MTCDERLRDVYTIRDAKPVLEEYLSSISITEDDVVFLVDWQEDNMNAFVAEANRLGRDPAYPHQAPSWIRTRPPTMTYGSFVDDLVYYIEQDTRSTRCGHIVLAHNDPEQFAAIVVNLISLSNSTFLQDAIEAALPVVNGVERHLAVTYYLTDSRVHRMRPVNLRPNRSGDNRPVRRLFI